MEKRLEFFSVDSLGRYFAEAIDISQRNGGGLEKFASVELQPEIASYLRTLRPDPKYQYVLMTPMGSYEFWGKNVNGDAFPDISLSFTRGRDNPVPVVRELEARWLTPFGKQVPPGNYTDFGHKTFLDAKRFRHHANKRPELAYGDIVLSVWNPDMHRVEVIVRHWREKAREVGAEEIIKDIDENRPRSISMGCRVPFDVCSRCGHISRTPSDYCDHLRTMMGATLNGGQDVMAVNFFPRFFDLSDVFVPAAKESGVLMKVAQVKNAQRKSASQNKKAEIEKEVLPNSGQDMVRALTSREDDLPRAVLRGSDPQNLLTTLAALGIILKPREFQDTVLCGTGQRGLADQMWEDHQVFPPSPSLGEPINFEGQDFNPHLARLLAPLLGDRSGFYPHLPARIVRITILGAPPPEVTKLSQVQGPRFEKIAEAYNSYRRAFRNLPQLLEKTVQREPVYYQNNFLSELLTDSMQKLSSSYHSMGLSVPLVPLYVYNAYRGTYSDPPSSWNFEVPVHSPARALLQPVL